MRALIVAVLCALAVVPGALAAEAPIDPPRLGDVEATRIALANDKVADWLERYPQSGRITDARFDEAADRWTVKVWWGEAGQIAEAVVDDDTEAVLEAWTGPQVAWRMARGYDGAFGGKKINEPWLWLTFAGIFLVGLADLRRPLSVRNLDLLALLGLSVGLWYFNEGDIFTSMVVSYAFLFYLVGRMLWCAFRGRAPTASRPVWPVWVLVAATVFVAGFRIGLNVEESNVIDVGYSGVIGAHRIVNGQAPYGHFPSEDTGKPCGPVDASGNSRDRIQTNGRCESGNPRGDTYGPVAYFAYVPGYLMFGWSGKWELSHGGSWPDLKAVHFTTLLADVLCILGLALVGRRFGGARLAATLAFAWAAYPFTQYASMSNTNDALPALFLIWGFWLSTSPFGRGALGALAGWTKLAALVVAPLWATYPERRLRPALVYVAGFAVATLAAFSVLLLEPDPLHAARLFWDRTIAYQLDRNSPFSLWDWQQYHARGLPDLHLVQRVLQGALVVGAVAVAFVPRRKSPFQLAALTAALLLGFELVLTHWSFLYIPWFFPFVAFTVLASTPVRVPVAAYEPRELGGLAPAR
jgi:hypothetical protein